MGRAASGKPRGCGDHASHGHVSLVMAIGECAWARVCAFGRVHVGVGRVRACVCMVSLCGQAYKNVPCN
jgi:hypothetical protein